MADDEIDLNAWDAYTATGANGMGLQEQRDLYAAYRAAIAEVGQLRAELDAIDRVQQLPRPVKARLMHLRMVNANLALALQDRDERLVAEQLRADEAFRRATTAEAEVQRLQGSQEEE